MKVLETSALANPAAEVPKQRYLIRAIERALEVLQAFLSFEAEASASQISKQTGLDLSTVFRILVTLEAHQFVEENPTTGKYRLGVSCLELGNRFVKDNDLRKCALPVLESLRNEYGETVHLAMIQGNEVVYLEKLDGLHPIGLMSSRVGGHAPAHCTGVGKALLAQLTDEELRRLFGHAKLISFTHSTITNVNALRKELAEIREKGYAIDREEHEVGVKCVAAAIFDQRGATAAISVSGPNDRMDEHIAKSGLLTQVQRAAGEVSAKMGGGPLPRHPDGQLIGSNV